MVRPLVVIGGSAAQNPYYGGHAWVFLQYLLGFRRLGYEVLLIDRLGAEMCSQPGSRGPDDSFELRRLREILDWFGLGESYCVLDSSGGAIAGISRREALARCRRSAFLLNLMGFLTDPDLLAAASKRVFLDIDPGFPQMWHELGLADVFGGHDVFATFGQNVGLPGCKIPACGRSWVHTRPPVVLEHWPVRTAARISSFATIGAWRGPYAPVEFRGETFGLRVHEFRALTPLPSRASARFRAALDIEPADARDIRLLEDAGWELLDPRQKTGDPWSYREFIADAGAELMVGKAMYVRSRSGWFSDRSACFLASGKPVLAQDTGLGPEYPTAEGLLLFDTLDDAAEGAKRIVADYERQARAARALAERLFDSDRVLSALAEEVEAS